LMTKFDKSGKIGCSNFAIRMFRFWQFQNEDQEKGKHEENSIKQI
jgi:hypothetical protein